MIDGYKVQELSLLLIRTISPMYGEKSVWPEVSGVYCRNDCEAKITIIDVW